MFEALAYLKAVEGSLKSGRTCRRLRVCKNRHPRFGRFCPSEIESQRGNPGPWASEARSVGKISAVNTHSDGEESNNGHQNKHDQHSAMHQVVVPFRFAILELIPRSLVFFHGYRTVRNAHEGDASSCKIRHPDTQITPEYLFTPAKF